LDIDYLRDVELMSRIPLEANNLGLGQSVQHAETFIQGLEAKPENRVLIERIRGEYQEENLFEEALNNLRALQNSEDHCLHFDFKYLIVKDPTAVHQVLQA
jgi:hypothetical protein